MGMTVKATGGVFLFLTAYALWWSHQWPAAVLCGHHQQMLLQRPKPNIIVILIDDQDWVLGGMEPMTITRRLLVDHGATFTNAFVSTPVCCPSRSSILTGKYVHNHGVRNNSVSGNCGSYQWQESSERRTMATFLQANGYATFYGGKYLNQYGSKETGGVKRIPPGYDRWIGLVGNSRYYNYTLSVDGQAVHHGDNYTEDYLTDILAKEALDFIARHVSSSSSSSELEASAGTQHSRKNKDHPRRPFFLMIAPPACHSPFTPAPQFSRKFAGRKAPRWPSFNRHPGMDKHWLVRQAPFGPLSSEIIDKLDHIFRERWRTLLSVDQMVGKIIKRLRKSGELDRTAIILTSDHGYHLGQFTMPVDKRLPYETDIRVPLILKPPNAGGGGKMTIESLAVVSIDLAPTVLDLAGIPTPPDMDGTSLLPLLVSTRPDIAQEEEEEGVKVWRTSFLVEYQGEADLADVDPRCPSQDPNTTLCLYDYGCKCQDAANNTYVCLRTLSPPREDSLYCHFADEEGFIEFYDLQRDPYQLNNTAFLREGAPACLQPSPSHRDLLERSSNCRGSAECFLA